MATKTRKIIYFIEYCALYLVQSILRIIPRKCALFCGSLTGLLLYATGYYRSVVHKNMEYVGIGDPKEKRRISRSLYRNLGRYGVDFLRPAYPLPPHTIAGFETMEPLLRNGKGSIVILSHLGNWELLATVFGKKTGRLSVVAKPMNNPYVDRWLLAKRNLSSVTTIYSAQALRGMLIALKNGGIVAILIDQYMRNHGTPVQFLNKPAKTVTTVAGIVLKTGCNVFSIKAIMQHDGIYTICLYPVPDLAKIHSIEVDTIAQIQKQHNDILSEQIFEHPDHWFGWFHKRFRGYVNYRLRNPSR